MKISEHEAWKEQLDETITDALSQIERRWPGSYNTDDPRESIWMLLYEARQQLRKLDIPF